MPAELRHLLFRPPEVVQAVKEYHRRLGQSLPPGPVVACGPESDEAAGSAVRFRITMASDPAEAATARHDPTLQEEVLIEGSTLAAALILHCRDRRIPLPAHADKSLKRFGHLVCLVATINPRQDDLPTAAQLRL